MENLAVLAIGGNSIIKDSAHQTVEDQLQCIKETVEEIVDLIEQGMNVVITHGNGPQVGFILRRSEIAHELNELHPVPLKNCVADTQGALGYQLQESLYNAFRKRDLNLQAVSVVTLVGVDKDDPSFQNPTKPIGSFFDAQKGEKLATANPEWSFLKDPKLGWRRVVPSPKPKKIMELNAIKKLVEDGFCLIAAGGGGIPVVEDKSGNISGIDAVIDKDLSSSLLATGINAEMLLISTSVEYVYVNFGKDNEKKIERMTVAEAKKYIDENQFAPGSMLPKVQAAIKFLENGGKEAIITSPDKLKLAANGKSGTHIVP